MFSRFFYCRFGLSMNTKITKLIVLAVILVYGCTSDNSIVEKKYSDPPKLLKTITLGDTADTLRPVRIQYLEDTLFVSYNRSSRIDLLDTTGQFIKSLILANPEPIFPTSFDIVDSIIFISDHTRGLIARFDREGNFINSFDLLPDKETPLMPFALNYYGGVLYVSDIRQKSILAISMVDAKGVTGMGELILEIPKDTTRSIEFPSVVYITFEGRLITSDAKSGAIEVYTCDGRYIYDFDSVVTPKIMTIQDMGVDHITDPDLVALDTNSFDPSGIRQMGRFHVVDANNSQIHMFNPLGEYINSYNGDSLFLKPSGLTINYRDSLIYVADPLVSKIFVFKY